MPQMGNVEKLAVFAANGLHFPPTMRFESFFARENEGFGVFRKKIEKSKGKMG
jgi:hypothetical protein